MPPSPGKSGRRRAVRSLATALRAILLGVCLASPVRATPARAGPVGIRQIEFIDARHGGRHLALAIFYPASPDGAGRPFPMPLFTDLRLRRNAPVRAAGAPYPLIMFSHGRGSNPLYYAWFAAFLASRGYVVAGLFHDHANTYDATIGSQEGKDELPEACIDAPEVNRAAVHERIGRAALAFFDRTLSVRGGR